jgi:hypothetical protein
VRTEGAILPPDLLERIREGDADIGGLQPSDYHLQGERLQEVISRSWSRLVSLWAGFRTARESLPERDLGIGTTRERWLLPLFQELGYGRLQTSKAVEIEGKSYAISHAWEQVPVHLVGFRVDLDRRMAKVPGAARMSPHGLMQELLNRSDAHTWGILSNGLKLRLLRDNTSLTRQAYVEFDLEAMFDGEAYADFALLWLACHQSRLEGVRPEDCWLERWSKAAQEQGTRALDQLRAGVEEAISALGRGFLAHPANRALREALRSGRVNKQDYYRQLLRIVYRLIFLFVAEDRELLFDPSSSLEARERYLRFYSTSHLRLMAERRVGTRHEDLYQALKLVMAKLGLEEGCPELGLPALGSFLWSAGAIRNLDDCALANHDLLEAISRLCFTTEKNIRRAVDYRNLGPEELGSVYEALLELQPDLNLDAGEFKLNVVGGSERKTTGSFYTPTSLISCLLDSALDPVVQEALKADKPEAALLDLKVCDPACGSGHFLVAAAHRIARQLASVRTGDPEPSPDATRAALRDVISHCIFGVDINPMAVELCKVNLWLEALDPGKPLSFLDHKIQCGNSLLGATPVLLAQGIPDEAFEPIEGDDKKFAASLRKQNKKERPKAELEAQGVASAQATLFDRLVEEQRGAYSLVASEVEQIGEDTVRQVRQKEERFRRLVAGDSYRRAKLVADAWCAAFAWRKTPDAPPAVTDGLFRRLKTTPEAIPPATLEEIERLASEFNLFQWHLAFPDAFAKGGFDCVLGNPPWVSYTGRQQADVSSRYLHLLVSRFPCISRWPSTHPAFLVLSTQLLNGHGRAGLVLPMQVADQAAYEAARASVDSIAHLASPVIDAGEDAFPGVTQAVGLFALAAGSKASTQWPARWLLKTGRGRGTPMGDQSRDDAVSTYGLAILPEILAHRPRFAPKTFADPGVHTGNVSKKIILASPAAEASACAPIREGKDIAAFVCGPAKKWLWVTPALAEGEYCTIRGIERYRGVPILVRQTADRPIAARHHDPTYFRNSLLACAGVPNVPDAVVVAFLNSALYAFLHRGATQDANQKAFPQVKVRHLHALPVIPVNDLERDFEGELLRSSLEAAALEAETTARLHAPPSFELLLSIERMVLFAFNLSPDLAPRLMEATK